MNSRRFISFAILLIFMLAGFNGNAKTKDNDKDKITIVLDPGHGGKDFGACENGAKEKEINLAVAKKLRDLINKELKDVNVVMTRSTDIYLTLQERADVANDADGDLFMSIHVNSVDKKSQGRQSVKGSSVYVLGLHKDQDNKKVAMRENSVIELESDYKEKYSGFDPSKDESYIIFEMAQKRNLGESIRVAGDAQNALVNMAGRANRGVRQAGFWVLWATSMPAVLVELDFICNPQSVKYMTSEAGEDELAKSLLCAIKKFVERRN
ncbi:MAG: N-acetylmuramoyl-L-alanine amidase [Muribaculaceae bacterium]|nr:N-acetylmuramoyl-L-alanine amidase [Muribaculaceae bacterium]